MTQQGESRSQDHAGRRSRERTYSSHRGAKLRTNVETDLGGYSSQTTQRHPRALEKHIETQPNKAKLTN